MLKQAVRVAKDDDVLTSSAQPAGCSGSGFLTKVTPLHIMQASFREPWPSLLLSVHPSTFPHLKGVFAWRTLRVASRSTFGLKHGSNTSAPNLCNRSELATMVPQPRSTVAGSSHIHVTVLKGSKTLPLEQRMRVLCGMQHGVFDALSISKRCLGLY